VSRPALGPTQPPVQWVPGVLSSGVKRGWGVTLTTHPHLVPRSWMSRSYTPLSPSASMACSGTAFLLFGTKSCMRLEIQAWGGLRIVSLELIFGVVAYLRNGNKVATSVPLTVGEWLYLLLWNLILRSLLKFVDIFQFSSRWGNSNKHTARRPIWVSVHVSDTEGITCLTCLQ
jgi:hypothetical protein